ncbi:GNAT family N-acetyltransferase [Nocardia sp. NPDC060256]|uniref:GNAT family N-acetyltransferase n=1 Tax=unclassified Nocardia TaxID=2637762 RepID=UPI00365C1E56
MLPLLSRSLSEIPTIFGCVVALILWSKQVRSERYGGGVPATIILTAPQTQYEAALRLRPWRSDDLPSLVAAHRDPGLRRWLTNPLVEEADARNWLRAQVVGWSTATRFSFAVVTDSEKLVGHVMAKVVAPDVAEVGYWTAAHARGHGVAARALETLSRWALNEQHRPHLTRLELLHEEGNHASCRVAEKSGFALHERLPAAPPTFPNNGHLHILTATMNPT